MPNRGRMDFRRSARSNVSSRRNIDIGDLIRLARCKVNSSNPRFGDDKSAGFNYYRKSTRKHTHPHRHRRGNLCDNRARGGYLPRCIQLFRCVRPTKPITRFARKTKLRMTTARNSNITVSLDCERE